MPSSATSTPKAALTWKYRDILFQYKTRLLLGIFTLLITNGLGVSIPWLVKSAVEQLQSVQPGVPTEALQQVLLLILGISFLMLITRVVSRQCILGVGRLLEYEFRNRLYGKIVTMPPSYFSVNPTGDLMSRMTNDVTAIRYMTGGGIMLLFNGLMAYLTSVPMMWAISPALTLSALVVFPIGIWLLCQLIPHIQRNYLAVQEILGDMTSLTQENLSGIRVIQSFAKEETEAKRFLKYCDRYLQAFIRLVDVRVWMMIVVVMMSGMGMLFILAIGGYQVIEKQMDLGGYVAFTLYLERLAWPTMAFGWALSTFQQGVASLERIDRVLSSEPTIADPSTETTAPKPPEAHQNHLSIQQLTVGYQNPYKTQTDLTEAEDEPQAHVPRFQLEDISLDIPGGSTVAIVGPVGSGKSTLLSLIPRLLELPKGKVFLDDQDILELPLEALRSRIAFMPQSSFLFSTSVTENLRYGQPLATQEQVETYASIVQMHSEIIHFPQQYETLVGERGVILSGGQRQRLALARTLMMEAGLLILDDPFSHLDSISEANIIQTLKERKAFGRKTTLFSTHRFALVDQADWVILMDQGRILAQGSHHELLQSQPLYQRLNQLDSLRQELGEIAG